MNTNVLEEHLILIFSTEVKVGMGVVYAGKHDDQTDDKERTGQAQSWNRGQETELCLD